MLILDLSKDGTSSYVDMTRLEVLEEARRDGESHLALLSNNKNNNNETKLLIQPRDLRLLDPEFVGPSLHSFIAPRLHCMLIALDPIRAVVLSHRILLFLPPGVDAMLTRFQTKLRSLWLDKAKGGTENEHEPDNKDDAFELDALEAILSFCVSELDASLVRSQSLILLDPRNNKEEDVITRRRLEDMRRLRNDLDRLEKKALDLERALNKVVGDPMDLSLMSFGKYEKEERVVEMMVESYMLQLDAVIRRLKIAHRKVDASYSVLQVHLDSVRNKLLRLEVAIQSIASATAATGLGVGIFSMNLYSGIENDIAAFWVITFIAVSGVIFFVWWFNHSLRRRGFLIL